MKVVNYIYDFFRSTKQKPMYIYIDNILINVNNIVRIFPSPNYKKDEYKVTLVDINNEQTHITTKDEVHMFKIINTLAARLDVLNLETIMKL